MKKLLSIFLIALIPIVIQATTRPQWVRKGETILNEQRSNQSYYFKIIQNIGNDLEKLRQQRVTTLAGYIGQRNNISSEATTEIVNQQGRQDEVHSSTGIRVTFTNESNTPVFYAQLVDEYWERSEAGYVYYALFAVSDQAGGQVHFDRFDVTRTYGALPAVMSIVPGAGQLYKGQVLKGVLMMSGAAIGVGAIVFCENERSSYAVKIQEQPRHAQTYKTKADNYQTARNVAIGATGALVVWSVIDAAVTPGLTRIKVRPGEQLHIRPTAFVLPDGMAFGASLTYSF